MEGIERCDFIALIVRDIPRAVHFYQETLGLPLRFQQGEQYALFQVAGTKLALQPARTAGPDLPVADDLVAPTVEAGVSVLIAFAVKDVDQWCATLRERGLVSFTAQSRHDVLVIGGINIRRSPYTS